MASLHDEVEQFFQRYARAAESMDATELAGMHKGFTVTAGSIVLLRQVDCMLPTS